MESIVKSGPADRDTTTLVTREQEFWSVTVTVYVPALNPFTVEAIAPVFHKYDNDPVPPDATTDTEPLAWPQVACVEEAVALIAVGWVTVNDCVLVQLLKSVIVTV